MKPLLDKGCSSKLFFQGLHAHKRNCSCLRVRRLDGTWTQSLFELDLECYDHFQRMFASPAAPTQPVIDAREVLLTQVQPILTMDLALPLEQPFSAKKLHDALLHLSKGKSPGWDGLTVEFYLAFWDELKHVLLAMINEAWDSQCMPAS